MLYQIKKIIFFLFAIVSIPLLFSWILYDLDSAFHIGSQIGIKLLPDTLFRDDAIILPIFLSLLFPTLGSLIYLIFYRRECSVWPKLLPARSMRLPLCKFLRQSLQRSFRMTTPPSAGSCCWRLMPRLRLPLSSGSLSPW